MIHHAVSVVGSIVFAGIAWLLSSNRQKIAWRTIAWAAALQLLIGLNLFRLPGSHQILLWVNNAVLVLLNASKSGSVFLFGPLAAALESRIHRLHPRLPGSSGSDFLCCLHRYALSPARVADIRTALCQTLPPDDENQRRRITLQCGECLCLDRICVVVRPYLEKMTRSELLLVLTTGLATVASSTLGVYVAFLTGVFPQIAGHLISASILTIPACVITAKLLIPETEAPETLAAVPRGRRIQPIEKFDQRNDSGSHGWSEAGCGSFGTPHRNPGIVALIDKLLSTGSSWLGLSEPLSLVRILGWGFYPFAFLLGLPPSDVPIAARLLGERVILTEVSSYNHLAQLISAES